jgi:hypothetical protein
MKTVNTNKCEKEQNSTSLPPESHVMLKVLGAVQLGQSSMWQRIIWPSSHLDHVS